MDDVIIVGSLDKKELEKSIQDLVDYVGNKTNDMASKFTEGLDKMKLAMKDFAITQKVSVDTMQEAWRKMSQSFDAMVAAQSASSRGGSSGGGSGAQPNTIGELKEQIRLQQQKVDEQIRGTAEAQKEVNIHRELQRQLKQETKDEIKRNTENAKYDLKNAMSLPQNDIAQATKRLQELQSVLSKWKGKGFLDVSEINRLENAIDRTKKKIEQLRNTKPKSIRDVLGMDESSVDAIAKKMAALKRVSVDPNNTAQVKQLGDEYQRLSKLQTQLLGKNAQAIRSNNMLAQSFGYIRNRVVYALTLGAMTNFVKQVLEIRGQYELLERSLGVLVGSFERGSEIFNELNQMAIKSPFTLIELGTAAKQLTAYNFAADEVVDTTRRLADISAALGVSMERLTYNLGQIKAQGVLNARDARDFANAGLAIVPMLAQMYTEQKRFGDQVVTTAQVYDMMSKKLVSYSDVLQVLYKITDEGGKFFDFQAKQAETLKVQINNLALAMNNMYNEIGASNQGFLVGSVQTIKKIFENWKTVLSIIQSLIVTYGAYRAILAVINFEHQRTWGTRIIVGITQYINAVRSATGTMATFNAVMSSNVVVAFASALMGLASYFLFFRQSVNETTADVERFGESGAKSLKKIDTFKKILEGTSETSSTYKKTLSELSTITEEYGVQLDKENAKRGDINSAIEQTIELIKTESAERQRANQLAKAQETYDTQAENARKELRESLKNAVTGTMGALSWNNNKELQENADAIADIVGSVVESNITLIAGKTGEEYEQGLHKMFAIIQDRMRAIGISESTISEQWVRLGLLENTNIINEYISKINSAKNAQDTYNEKIEKNYEIAKKATEATMTFTEKVDANARALRNNANDAVSLYNKIYDIVKIAQQNHVINFDLKLTAQKPPQWMQNIDLPELQRLAARFTAIAQSGGHAKGYTRETTYEQGLLYASAAREKQYKEERKALEDRNKHDKKTKSSGGGSKKDPFAEALKDEIELINNIQKRYNEYRKMGVSTQEAITKAAEEYNNTLMRVNTTLSKYGVQTMSAQELANMDLRGVRDYYKSLLDVAKGANNAKGIESLEKAIANINVEITKADYKKLTDGLNNELGKLKEEYELGIELDANPELGDVFADMMGISDEQLESLPKDFESVARRLQSIIDTQLGVGKFNLMENLNKATLDNWIKQNQHGTAQDDEMTKVLTAYVDYANKVRLDETKKQTDEWNKLLEKYSEYEYKITQIRQQAERERETARKKNAPQGVFDAINLREQRELAKLNFEEFQKSPEWIVATGDLAGLTDKALGSLIKSLEEYKKKAKNLDPKQIKNLNNALKNLRKQQREGNPFLQIANALDDAKTRAELFQPEMDAIMSDIIALENEIGNNKPTKEQAKQLNNLKKMWKDLAAQGDVSATQIVEGINASIAAASQAITMFTDMADALGGEHMTEASENIKRVVGVIEKAGQGAAIGAQIGGGYGAIIGAVAGGLSGLITNFADQWSGNRSITKRVQESERAVKRLEIAYVDLQHAMDNAYGTNIVGAKKAAQANKELQLQELQRQLLLEKSRESKNRDEDKILDLQKTIKELQYEITDMTTEIVNDLMGISSVGDFAENLVESMIEAFRQGEDYMKVFEGKFEEMIDNMIMKSIVSRVMTQYMDNLWSALDERITARSNQEADDYAKAHAENIELKNLSDDEILNRMGYDWYDIITLRNSNKAKYDKLVADYKKAASDAETSTKQALDTVSAINDSDISWVMEQLGQTTPELAERLKELISQYYSFGDKANGGDNLSGLQQGIQSVTEETAGALEAYMNSVSQQVYLHSDLLTQIRDAVVGFDLDVQTATVSQILLQLQNSYQVQMSIQSILSGWSNPSGMAMRVEMVS